MIRLPKLPVPIVWTVLCVVGFSSGCQSSLAPWLKKSSPADSLAAHSSPTSSSATSPEPPPKPTISPTPTAEHTPQPTATYVQTNPPPVAQSRDWQLPPIEAAPTPEAASVTTAQANVTLPSAPTSTTTSSPNASLTSSATANLADASPIVPLAISAVTNAADKTPVDLTKPRASEVQLASATETIPPAPPQSVTSQATPASANGPTILLQIENIRLQRGPVKVAIFTDAKTFLTPGGVWNAFELPHNNQTASSTIEIDKPCAIAVFQDIDGNGELTKNRLGIPVEPCAFSGGAVIKRGPPQFSEAVITPGPRMQPIQAIIRLP